VILPALEKVTAFIIRTSERGRELLLFEHPYAGVQIPAGTVEVGESPEAAALREAVEETGLTALSVSKALGDAEEIVPEGQRVVLTATKVYARPDLESFDWAYLRRGITVTVERRVKGFVQVTYQEFDRVPHPHYVTMQITGWVPEVVLTDRLRRHFFLLDFPGCSPARWLIDTDNHRFTLFWAPLTQLPEIIPPQDQWLAFLNLPGS
jgi:8-oxo-dGTP pyrophosphatase MutT (NUDIX family)